MALSDSEIERYQRHIVLREIGGAGQQKLKAARVLIIGMGGLGHPVAQYLAAAGVGTLGLVDDDHVHISNLQRQILFDETDVGAAKTAAAAARLQAQNPHVEIATHGVRVSHETVDALVGAYDVIIDATDNFATRFVINDACFRAKKILVSGAVGRFDGQIATFKPWLKDKDGLPLPCYRSLVPHAPDGADEADDCARTGIIGALTGIIGSLQALEAIKEITETGDSLAGFLLIYDGLAGTARRVKLRWDPQNPNNGNRDLSKPQ